MGLFDGFKKKENEAGILLEKHENKVLNDKDFLKAFGNMEVYYTTPFGDHKDGGQRLFVIPGPDKTGYMPVFISEQDMKNFYEQAGRKGYLIMKAPFISIIETNSKTNKSNTPVKLGLIIDPIKYKVTLDVPMIDPIIRFIRG
ncbi:MAG: hypothetical protein K5871_01230 [Lachnospiraceae bacterium]|nr:hypothetical protein [Lachnospiraceae bacterium]